MASLSHYLLRKIDIKVAKLHVNPLSPTSHRVKNLPLLRIPIQLREQIEHILSPSPRQRDRRQQMLHIHVEPYTSVAFLSRTRL